MMSSRAPNPPQPPPAPPGGERAPQSSSYFQPDNKKGEVNELKTLLRDPGIEKDPKRKRDVIKKVIAYMTLGIDVSRLFTEMVMSIETRDLVVKKMVYHYLSTYAHEKPEMGLMCINTLQRDCSNEDPMVRGLALRSLCSLRLPSVLEYISAPLRASLTDPHSYVRKTGVMGILKVYNLDKDLVKSGDFVDILYNMLRDVDGLVVTNCIVALDEIMLEEGGIAINTAIVHHMLGRLNDFNEWGLGAVLRLVARYEPESDEETFGIMNVLDPVLRTSNSGVVLEAIGCFVRLTEHLPDLHGQVYDRVKAPLLTLMAGGGAAGGHELLYCLLKHAELLVSRSRDSFASEYRNFYIRYDEPSPVKHSKVALLAGLATEVSADSILAELKEYAGDVEPALAKAAIGAIGTIASRLRSKSADACALLVDFLESGTPNVKSEALLVAKDVLRRYPERRGDLVPSLGRYLRELDQSAPDGRSAAVWIVGRWGEEIVNAPYMLEPLVDNYEDEASVDVKLALLTAATRLFFKRPPEMQAMLGRLIQHALDDSANPDVRDRALLYFRLLRRDVKTAKSIVDGKDPCAIVGDFAEEANTELRDRIFDNFNTLAVIYGQTPDQFVAPAKRAKDEHVAMMRERRAGKMNFVEPTTNGGANGEDAHDNGASVLDAFGAAPESTGDLLGGGDEDETVIVETPPPPVVPDAAPSGGILDSFDLLGGAATDAPMPVAPAAPQLVAAPNAVDPASFQAKWAQIPTEHTFEFALGELPSATTSVDAALTARHVYTMASGELATAFKFFFFAQDASNSIYLVQCVIDKSANQANLTVKVEGSSEPACVRDAIASGLADAV